MNLFVMMECKKKLKIAVLGHFAECCTRQRTLLPSAMVTALGKAKKNRRPEDHFPALSSAVTMALGKEFFFKKNSNIAECRSEGTRQRICLKKSNFAERWPGGTQQRIFRKKNKTSLSRAE